MSASAGERPLSVLTAIVNPSLEAALVAGFTRHDLGVTVVRRCVDLVELLSAAASGTAQAVLVSADLRGLDRESLAQLAGSGLATVGLADTDVEERLLHQLGVDVVVAARAPAEQVAGALLAGATACSQQAAGSASVPYFGGAYAAVPQAAPVVAAGSPEGPGVVVAVWGTSGAPGRTTLAIGLADALAVSGVRALLIDADPYGGAVAILTGMLDESPGITAACRAANAGALDVARLAECCREIAPGLRVLAGISQPSRWAQLRPASLEHVIALSRWLADVVVVDTGFSLENDEELSYDTVAPRRNAATLTALGCADQVVAVGSAEPVGAVAPDSGTPLPGNGSRLRGRRADRVGTGAGRGQPGARRLGCRRCAGWYPGGATTARWGRRRRHDPDGSGIGGRRARTRTAALRSCPWLSASTVDAGARRSAAGPCPPRTGGA